MRSVLERKGCKGKEEEEKKEKEKRRRNRSTCALAFPSSLPLLQPLVIASYSPVTSAAAARRAPPLHFVSSFSPHPPPFFLPFFPFPPLSLDFKKTELSRKVGLRFSQREYIYIYNGYIYLGNCPTLYTIYYSELGLSLILSRRLQ
eukprot:TRINITY_DN9229_c1_g1_i1.p1 TRINITY_DN9229_c1_g1~~TRINITY_DN9229_c1_g1_i1.p1  ORF type:complete len:146 (-),score=19.96 TRINITY_DN9229_c1_g1_i1:311-748(-)